MRKLVPLLSLLCFAILMTSCKPTKEVVYVDRTVEVKVTETIHDTVLYTQPDSSLFMAELKVNEAGAVELINTVSHSGKNMDAPKVSIKNNKLQVDCKSEAERLFFQWKEKELSKIQTQVVHEPIPYPVEVPAKLSWLQTFLLWVGSISIILLTAAFVFMLIRWRNSYRS